MSDIKSITKRDGTIVPFVPNKIQGAISKALKHLNKDVSLATGLTKDTIKEIEDLKLSESLTVEVTQDIVELILMKSNMPDVAKAYIIYRNEHTKKRQAIKPVNSKLKEEYKESSKHFNSKYEELIYLRTYSKWLELLGRREMWSETVKRYMDFMKENLGNKLDSKTYDELYNMILKREILPSMRLLQCSGEPARRENLCGYNCSYIAPTCIKDLCDIMYLSCNGVGVGFSVELINVDKFPVVKGQSNEKDQKLETFVIPDSKEGWCDSLGKGLQTWYDGKDVTFDYSKIRPAGARLKVMGGRASGPEPLKNLLNFTRSKILSRQGFKLSTLDMHDIICKIGEIVKMGGVRRCHPKGSRVLIKGKSFMAIEDVKVGDETLTDNGWKKVKNLFIQGKQKCARVFHQNGYIDCTTNHRLAVLKDSTGKFEWKEAKDISIGERLGFPIADEKNANVFGDTGKEVNKMPEFKYVKPKHSTTCKDITIPALDEWMSWFIGNFQGDGYVGLTKGKGELSTAVYGDDKDQAEKTKEQYMRFGVNCKIQQPTVKDYCLKVRVASKQLATYMYANVKQAKVTLRVPNFIKVASQKIKAAYVQGIMDADGSVKGHPIQIVVTVYEDFAKDIQSLLYSMGIMTRLKFKKRAQENWQDQYILVLVNNRDKEIFINLTKDVGFKKFKLQDVTQNTNRWPIDMIDKKELAKDWEKSVASNATHMTSDKALALGIKSKILPTEITCMMMHETEVDTYDLEVEDNHCFVCEGILTHNSAMISLSDLNDQAIRGAKTGEFWKHNGQRSMANNSAVYNSKPSDQDLIREWSALLDSYSGERGIFNRAGFAKQLPERRLKLLGDRVKTLGCNPCGEIILQSHQLCNLSTVVCRPYDTPDTLVKKVIHATILGTYQATLTNFKYVSDKFKTNCEEERLLGVSLTGQFDCKVVRTPQALQSLKEAAIKANIMFAKQFGITQATAVTCVKPEGTTGALTTSSCGIHPAFAPYYRRRVRISAHDPLFKLLKDSDAKYYPETGQTMDSANTYVLEVPLKSADGAITEKDMSGLDMFDYWKIVKDNYCEHNASTTVKYSSDETIDLLKRLKDNWETVGGLAFLPRDDAIYPLAPIEPMTKEEYEREIKIYQALNIDFSKLSYYELDDQYVDTKKTPACAGGVCHID